MIIAVIGAGEPSNEVADLAENVGRELGKWGITLVCGGLGGVMEAACRGAKSAGGTTIGVLPGSDPTVANRWVDYPICTGLSYARNVIIVKTGRAVIAVGGAYGTLSEIGHALSDGVPVVGLRTWGLIPGDVAPDSSILVAENASEAVGMALEAAKTRELKGS